MPEVLVATTAKRKKSMKRRPGSRVRFCTPDGVWHEFLNEAVPTTGPLLDSLCIRCGHGYSHLIAVDACLCNECRTQDIMDAAAQLEAQGIEMGAGTMGRSSRDPIADRMMYDIRTVHLATIR
jgi:hypothetical protein